METLSTEEYTEDHQELLDEFKSEFENYSTFAVFLGVDHHTPNYNRNLIPVHVLIVDLQRNKEFVVNLDKDGNMFYDVYDGNWDEISSPQDMWKYMYLSL